MISPADLASFSEGKRRRRRSEKETGEENKQMTSHRSGRAAPRLDEELAFSSQSDISIPSADSFIFSLHRRVGVIPDDKWQLIKSAASQAFYPGRPSPEINRVPGTQLMQPGSDCVYWEGSLLGFHLKNERRVRSGRPGDQPEQLPVQTLCDSL